MTSSPRTTRGLPDNGSFLRFLTARAFAIVAYQMVTVAIGWQMYDLTRSAFNLGLVGLVQFLPSVLLVLPVPGSGGREGPGQRHRVPDRAVPRRPAPCGQPVFRVFLPPPAGRHQASVTRQRTRSGWSGRSGDPLSDQPPQPAALKGPQDKLFLDGASIVGY
ncbi:hypothetical protein [Geobacter sp. SVR]|uniref:hypothetical protein n=1 Tax=Geobacter sp. SVR TaxID=2495594 RepID=UPI001950CC2D|nr:hypothetical protein [Geobacter sp. SVR]